MYSNWVYQEENSLQHEVNSISFKLSAEEQKDKEESKKMKLLKKFRKADEFFFKKSKLRNG